MFKNLAQSLEQNLEYRRSVMRAMLMLVMIGGSTFSSINFYRGLWELATLELFFIFFAFFLWRKILHTSHFQRWINVFLCPFFATMVYAMYVPNSSESMILLAHVYETNREKNEARLLELAGTDDLTGLANRMKLEETFTLYVECSQRNKSPLAVVLFDLDYFKNINDQHGHQVGDATLKYIAHFIKNRVRKTDLLVRFGGEEFVLLMAGSKEKDCYQQIDFIRQQLTDMPFVYNGVTIAITISAGISTYEKDGKNLEALLLKADQRLYLAKDNGRNCVVDANNGFTD